jgi:hypothetical protein
VELPRHGQQGVHGVGRLQRRMKMRAVQLYHRPSAPSRFLGCVIVNRRALNEASRDVVPAGEFDRVVEPLDRQFWQFALELRECDGVSCQKVQTNQGRALGIGGEPSRPDRKTSIAARDASYEIPKRGPDRRGSASRWRHLTVDDDNAAARQPVCEIGDQRTCRAVADQYWLVARRDALEQVGRPATPGRRRLVVEDIWNLDVVS